MTSCAVCKSYTRSRLTLSLLTVRNIIRNWNGAQYSTSESSDVQKNKKDIKKPPYYWSVPSNRKLAMQELGKKLGFTKDEDWYKIKGDHFTENGFRGLLNHYNGIPALAVMDLVSDKEWQGWKFDPIPKGFWDQKQSVLDFMKWVGKQMGFKTFEDWYQIKHSDLSRYGGWSLLQTKYKGSPSALVMDTWPEHKWQSWHFHSVPEGYWDIIENQQQFIGYVSQKLNLSSYEDWYSIRESDVIKLGGISLLDKYSRVNQTSPSPPSSLSPSSSSQISPSLSSNSISLSSTPHPPTPLARLVTTALHEHPWDLSRFVGYKPSKSEHRSLLELIGAELGYTKMDDYYNLSNSLLTAHGGLSLLHEYNYNCYQIVSNLFSEYSWIPWKFSVQNMFDTAEMRERYMEYLYSQMGFTQITDWYKISMANFVSHYGRALIRRYDGRVSDAVMDILPTAHTWEPWLFQQLPSDFWSNEMMQRFVQHLSDKLDYKTMDDWYQLTNLLFSKNGGKELMRKKNKEAAEIVMEVFPEHVWQAWKFPVAPKGFWNKSESREQFLEYLGERLGYKKKEDWYGITQKDISTHGGQQLLNLYNSSPSAIIMDVFIKKTDDHEWIPWKFKRSKSFSSSMKNQESLESYIAHVSKQLKITELSDWYRVALPQLQEFGPTSYIKELGLPNALQKVYPEHNWETDKFQLAWQKWLKHVLEGNMDDVEVIENYVTTNPYDESGKPMTADIFIPELKLALEYNGKSHYAITPLPNKENFYSYESDAFFGNVADQKAKDAEKTAMFDSLGITLIQVPHWWDGKVKSLTEVIHKKRPDVKIWSTPEV